MILLFFQNIDALLNKNGTNTNFVAEGQTKHKIMQTHIFTCGFNDDAHFVWKAKNREENVTRLMHFGEKSVTFRSQRYTKVGCSSF